MRGAMWHETVGVLSVEALHVRLLGGFELRRASGEALILRSRKAVALIAYLALQPEREQSREKLASLLWEDRPEAFARASLRQTLFTIRQLLPDRPIITEPRLDWLALDQAGLAIDAEAFEDATARGGIDDLTSVVHLFRGDLLEGIRIRSESFESWLMSERQHFRSAALNAMHLLLEGRQPATADDQIHIALKALRLDPTEESAHRTLMRLYAASGRRAEALRQYFRCRDTLWRELFVRPEAATDMLYNAVLAKADRPGGSMLSGRKGADQRRH
jgi:DNA-binding SARP family transcriptional activator